MGDRELTQEEIDLAPEWATNYLIDNHNDVLYRKKNDYSNLYTVWWVGLNEPLGAVGDTHHDYKPIPRKKIDITEYEFSDTAIENVEGDKHHIVVANSEYTTQYTEEDIDMFKAHFVALRGGNHE